MFKQDENIELCDKEDENIEQSHKEDENIEQSHKKDENTELEEFAIRNIISEIKYIEENVTFIILRHMREQKHKKLWFKCYQSILFFYPSSKIIVIDDNSKIKDERDFIIQKDCLIYSEFPGAGEFLPYYYFLKYKWSPKMCFLHDSMFIKYPLYMKHFKPDISSL
jgi:hypothetical protein